MEKRSVTADTALRLARYFNTTAELWAGLQADSDLRLARCEKERQIERDVKLDLAHSRLRGGSRQWLAPLPSVAWPALPPLCPGSAQLADLSQFPHAFLLHHLGRIPSRRDQALAGSP